MLRTEKKRLVKGAGAHNYLIACTAWCDTTLNHGAGALYYLTQCSAWCDTAGIMAQEPFIT